MAITHVQSKNAVSGSIGTNPNTFSFTAANANDAVCFFISGTTSSGTVTGITLTSPGWTITQIVSVFGPGGTTGYAAAFGAISPNTSASTFTFTYSGSSPSLSFQIVFVDEFTATDTTGSTTTFDAHNSGSSASTFANVSVTPANDNDAVWFGISDNTNTTTPSAGSFSTGCNDAGGDATEYQILTGGSGTPLSSNWNSASGAYLMAGMSIKPKGTATVIIGQKSTTGGPSFAI